MFWSVRRSLWIPAVITTTVRRWSEETDYSLLPNYSDSPQGRRESEWSVASASDTDKEKEKDVRNKDVETKSDSRIWTRAVLLVLILCLGIWGLRTSHSPAKTVQDLLEEEEVISNHELVREVIYDIEDPTHISLAPQRPLPSPRRLLGPSVRSQTNKDLLAYMSTGFLPSMDEQESRTYTEIDQIDIVYLWVNSTDPSFPEAFAYRMEEEGLPVDRGQARRWRDNGELRGSVRSSVQSLGDNLRKIHIVSGDYPLEVFQDEKGSNNGQDEEKNLRRRKLTSEDDDTEMTEGWTIGQIPEWLDWAGDDETVTWHFHSDIYRLPRDPNGELLVGREVMGGMVLLGDDGEFVHGTNGSLEQEWRELALPTFNSFAIESRVGWVTGLSEKFVMSNDDMFFLNPLSTSDFHHPLLGPVLRMAPSLPVYPYLTPDLLTTHGEWGGLQHASSLLSKRFTNRPQAYPEHFPKSLTLPMMDEASIMFAEELSIASTRGFRESKRGTADIEMAALASWLRIERWREALLWTWIVGKVGGVEGVWDGGRAKEELRYLFGNGLEEGKNGKVRMGPRKTIEDADMYLSTNNLDEPLSTRIRFSSMDGHLPKDPDNPVRQCLFMPFCLPDNFFTDTEPSSFPAEDVFTLMAFQRPQCGDCLIKALVTASGERGLNAFLPDPESIYKPSHPSDIPAEARWDDIGPILPLTKEWRTTNFSLQNVIPSTPGVTEVNLREWCLSLLSRYVYTIGATPAIFAPVNSAFQLSTKLALVDKRPETALVCVNDDIKDHDEKGAVRFKALLEGWMDRRWPTPGSWERVSEKQ